MTTACSQMTDRPKLLFVCSQNKWRSLTAQKIYEGFPLYQVRSAGTDKGARVRITGGHIGWADWIFVMEKKHLQLLASKYSDELKDKRVICLNIADDFEFMDRELIELLKSKLSEYVQTPD
jgi:predicted protein tyrosine phosphatase